MPNENENTTLIILIITIIGAFFAVLIISGLVIFFSDFRKELGYINFEINRSTGGERCYWKRKRRRLWLSLIPFVSYK